ncbi:molybdenum cofactor biosynthesis protein B [Devosia enhydra]|uniref:Molybdenum cofactor biosynthesis protein B n=1 Tax=Devosia enhydra TaxID=665118 RepID=A0A1K2I136_9HYPH|nr:molybdenum cofactor biosynthesis protein B [Devosia enhydra]SFZ86094.1 molybdenum cofactor biosynthesis protein B [Devosia enhydra]
MFKAVLDDKEPFVPLKFAVLAVSDTRTLETDTAGALLKTMVEADGHVCAVRAVCKDDRQEIRAHVQAWVADPEINVILTTGGTGFSGRDVTPEAIEPLFDKRMEGFSVLFHMYSANNVGTSTLQSRATGGVIGTTYVFVLPGSRGAVRDAWEGILRYQLSSQHTPCNLVELLPRLNEK